MLGTKEEKHLDIQEKTFSINMQTKIKTHQHKEGEKDTNKSIQNMIMLVFFLLTFNQLNSRELNIMGVPDQRVPYTILLYYYFLSINATETYNSL